MQLFDIEADSEHNWLPYDGTVQYYGKVVPHLSADDYLDKLLQNIAWENDQAIIFGRKIITKRKVAWYGDQAFEYTYSNIHKYALPWTKELLELKVFVESLTGELFNSCLLNLITQVKKAWLGIVMMKQILREMVQSLHSVLGQKEDLHLNINIVRKKSSCT